MNQEIIRSFCDERDPRILHKLTPTAKALLVDGCFSVLFQKFGDHELAAVALEELGEIKKLRYKANEAEGKANFQKKKGLHRNAVQKAWKKLIAENSRVILKSPWITCRSPSSRMVLPWGPNKTRVKLAAGQRHGEKETLTNMSQETKYDTM